MAVIRNGAIDGGPLLWIDIAICTESSTWVRVGVRIANQQNEVYRLLLSIDIAVDSDISILALDRSDIDIADIGQILKSDIADIDILRTQQLLRYTQCGRCHGQRRVRDRSDTRVQRRSG